MSKKSHGIAAQALSTMMTTQRKEGSAGPGPWRVLMPAKQQRPNGRFVLPRSINSLFLQIGSPKTLSWGSLATL